MLLLQAYHTSFRFRIEQVDSITIITFYQHTGCFSFEVQTWTTLQKYSSAQCISTSLWVQTKYSLRNGVLHLESHQFSCAWENLCKVRNCRWKCSRSVWKCCTNVLVHPYVPQEYCSRAPTAYTTQEKSRDWDRICTADPLICIQLFGFVQQCFYPKM